MSDKDACAHTVLFMVVCRSMFPNVHACFRFAFLSPLCFAPLAVPAG